MVWFFLTFREVAIGKSDEPLCIGKLQPYGCILLSFLDIGTRDLLRGIDVEEFLLRSHRFDRVEPGRPRRRVDAEDQSHTAAHAEGQKYRPEGYRGVEAHRPAAEEGEREAERDADRSA